jgi:uncharacterized membrane protein YgcG
VTGERDALLQLDRALDALAGGGATPPAPDAAGEQAAEAAALADLAAALRDAVPAPRGADAAARGRAALLAAAPVWSRRGGTAGRRLAPVRRRLALALAAALLAVAVPAAMAGQARPGTPLWPLRQAGQQARLGLAADPVERAHLRLNTAAMLLDAAREGGGYQHEGLAVRCREQATAALAQLGGRPGPRAAAERARAEGLLAELDWLARSAGDGGRRGSGPERGGDRSGPGGGDRSGPGGGGGEEPGGD